MQLINTLHLEVLRNIHCQKNMLVRFIFLWLVPSLIIFILFVDMIISSLDSGMKLTVTSFSRPTDVSVQFINPCNVKTYGMFPQKLFWIFKFIKTRSLICPPHHVITTSLTATHFVVVLFTFCECPMCLLVFKDLATFFC